MASLKCSLESRAFLALIRGLSKRLFHDDSDITLEYLYNELYSSSSDTAEDAMSQIRSYEDILLRAATENWDLPRLDTEAHLLGGITPDQLSGLLTYWGSERTGVSVMMQL